MVLHTLCIVNKSGGLIYTKHFSDKQSIQGNDYLRIASTFHSLYEISEQISPSRDKTSSAVSLAPSGIESIDADSFTISCFKSPTGKLAQPIK